MGVQRDMHDRMRIVINNIASTKDGEEFFWLLAENTGFSLPTVMHPTESLKDYNMGRLSVVGGIVSLMNDHNLFNFCKMVRPKWDEANKET